MRAYSLLLLLGALASPGCALPLRREGPRLHAPSVDQSSCDTCVDVARDFEQYLADPKTQDSVVAFVQQNVCALLPSDTAATCSQEARVLVAQAVASMEQNFPPRAVCEYMGACQATHPSTSALDSLREASGFVECPLCRLVMTTLVQRLKDPVSHAAIESNAEEACRKLGSSGAVAKCLGDVAQLFAALDALLDDVSADRACQVVQLCDADGSVQVAAPPESLAQLRQLAARLAAVPTLGSPEDCDACKSVIAQAAATLLNPDTQEQIIRYVKAGCSAFEDYEAQCKEYVDEYGQAAFMAAVAYLQPEPVCIRLGYCKPTPTA